MNNSLPDLMHLCTTLCSCKWILLLMKHIHNITCFTVVTLKYCDMQSELNNSSSLHFEPQRFSVQIYQASSMGWWRSSANQWTRWPCTAVTRDSCSLVIVWECAWRMPLGMEQLQCAKVVLEIQTKCVFDIEACKWPHFHATLRFSIYFSSC